MTFWGGYYGSRGGQSAEEKRLAMLEELADREKHKGIPDGLKTAFVRTAEFLSRPNYAIAGVVDVLQNTGEEGESVGGRVLRELFTNRGDKEAFGEVLRQGGVPEGGNLSDIIGENKLTKYFDPSARGAAGLAMDIFLDPTTYITMGSGNVAKAVGRAGEIALSANGRATLNKMITNTMRKRLRPYVKPKDMEALIAKGETEFLKTGRKILARQEVYPKWADASKRLSATKLVDASVLREAEERLVNMATRRVSALESPSYLRWAGMPVVSTKTLTAPIRASGDKLAELIAKGPGGGRLINFMNESVDDLDKLFNSVPRLARKVRGYKRLRDTTIAYQRGAGVEAEETAKEILGKMFKGFDEDSSRAFVWAVEKGDEESLTKWAEIAAKKFDMSTEESVAALKRWHDVHRMIGYAEVNNYLLDAGQLANYEGKYFAHHMANPPTKDEISRFKTVAQSQGKFTGEKLRQYSEVRHVSTIEELEELQKVLGKDFGIEYDPTKVLVKRTREHIRAMHEKKFVEDVQKLYGKDFATMLFARLEASLPNSAKALRGIADQMTEKEADDVDEILQRISTVVGKDKADENIAAKLAQIEESLPQNVTIADLKTMLKAEIGEADEATIRAAREKYVSLRQTAIREDRQKKFSQFFANKNIVSREKRTLEKVRAAMGKMVRETDYYKNMQIAKSEMDTLVSDFKTLLSEEWATKSGKEFTGLVQAHINKYNRLRKSFEEAIGKKARADKKRLGSEIAALEKTRKELEDAVFVFRVGKTFAAQDVKGAKTLLKKAQDESFKARREKVYTRQAIRVWEAERRAEIERIGGLSAIAQKARDVAKIKSMRPEVQAAVMYESLMGVTDIHHLERVMAKWGEAFEKVPNNAAAKVRALLADKDLATLTYGGMKYGDNPFTKGVLNGKSFYMPEGIRQDFENFKGMWSENPEVGRILTKLDRVLNSFRLWVTIPFPAFHTRNAYSNVASSFVDIGLATLDPRRHAESMRILFSKADGTVTSASGRKYTYNEVRSLLDAMDVRTDRLTLSELVGQGRTLFGEENLPGVHRMASIGQSVENEARALHFIAGLRRGLSPPDAAIQTKKFLFDYADLSPFERKAMRRLFPFWTWTSKNTRRQVRNLIENPGRMATQVKMLRGPESDMLPEYLRGDVKIKLEDQDGKKGTYLTNIDLPINNIDVLWRGGLGRTMRENFAMVTPFIKNPVEYMTGINSFTGRSIHGRQFMGAMGPALDRRLPKWMKDYLEMDSFEAKDGRTLYKANGTKLWLLTKATFASRLINEGVRVDDMAFDFSEDGKPNYSGLWRMLTGMQFREMDLDEAQKMEIRNKVEALEKHLLESGAIEEFRRTYVPANKRQQSVGGGFWSR